MGLAIRKEDLPYYTYKDYLRWEGQWELIKGIPYAMSPSPVFNHQRVNTKILQQLTNLLEDCEACEAIIPTDWKIADDTVVQPDAMVICGEIKTKWIEKAPELIFEILSPSTANKDKNLKFQLYQSEKVNYYIIVDIEGVAAEIYELEKNKYQLKKKTKEDTFLFEIENCKIEFDFSKIWKK